MIYHQNIPLFPLSEYVESMVYYKGYNPDHPIERLLPDGGTDLIIDLTESPKYIYDNETLLEKQACRQGWVSGMRTTYISIQARASESEMMVVRFRTGAAWSVLHLPVAFLKNRVVEAIAVLGNDFLFMREQLLYATTPEEKFNLLAQYLTARIRLRPDIPKVLLYSVFAIQKEPAAISVKKLVQKTGYTHKHLISLFDKYAGIEPKQFARVLKFQQAVQLMEEKGPSLPWSQLALECGYYDQAHFINEFRKFSGFNPSAYMNARGEYLNYLPIQTR